LQQEVPGALGWGEARQLVNFLQDFHNDRAEDEQFTDEKEYLMKQIREL
jgi:calcium binding protein 39